MLAYQLLEVLVQDLAGGSKRRFENRTGLRDSFIISSSSRKAPTIHAEACDKIERAYGIKLIVHDDDYLGYRRSGQDIYPVSVSSRKTRTKRSAR